MSAYIIVDITVQDPGKYRQYVDRAPEFVAKHRGQYIVRGGEVTVAEGAWQPDRLVVVEFPSREHAMAFLEDPDYRSLATVRNQSTISNLVVVDGC